MIRLFLNNLDPSILDTITVGDVPVDLTGATVKFNMRPADSATPKISHAGSVRQTGTDPNFVNKGGVQYDWLVGDLNTPDNYRAWWEVTYNDGTKQDTPEFDIKVLAHEPGTADLCTIFDVRESANLPSVATADDDQIQELIIEASAEIMKSVGREFAPPSGDVAPYVTRRFEVKDYRVDFYPYDLRTLHSVVLHPEEVTNEQSLDILLDVDLRPVPATDGVYTAMLLTPWLSLISERSLRFRWPLVDVTGAWGFASVPADVKRAAVIAVRSWLRRDSQVFANVPGMSPGNLQPSPQGTYHLPYASQCIIERYRRWAKIV